MLKILSIFFIIDVTILITTIKVRCKNYDCKNESILRLYMSVLFLAKGPLDEGSERERCRD